MSIRPEHYSHPDVPDSAARHSKENARREAVRSGQRRMTRRLVEEELAMAKRNHDYTARVTEHQ